jgi:LacI family transcriptional regulator
MNEKRVTIYDLAREIGVSASYISKALNGHPSVNAKMRETVMKKAFELNYQINSQAANLRLGSSKTIGVIVPHINQSFFSDAIAGIEEICFKNNHSLIICQSHESYSQECKAIETLIHQNVACILISISEETRSYTHLENIHKHHISLIQFDRCTEQIDGFKVFNDNEEAAYNATKNLFENDYKKVAFIGGPDHIAIFKHRKEGFMRAHKESGLSIPYNFIVEDSLTTGSGYNSAAALFSSKEPPDAFLTVSDNQALGILKFAELNGIKVPEQLGVFGFANEAFSNIIKPSLSSINQKSKELGQHAAKIYFDLILKNKRHLTKNYEEVIKSEVIIRESTKKGKK